jgi:hypothetical protein
MLNRDVGFAFKNGHRQTGPVGPFRAINGLMRRSKAACYSITSSARANNAGDSCRPSCRAAFLFTTNSNSVGA